MKQKAHTDFSKKLKESMIAYLFLLPAAFFFIFVYGYPIVQTLFVLPFQKYKSLLVEPTFCGWENYSKMFSDPVVGEAFLTTLELMVILVALHLILGLLLAVGATRSRVSDKMSSFYKTIIYFPSILTASAIAIAFGYLFNYDFGVVNWVLKGLGFSAVPWMNTRAGSMAVICIFSLWTYTGRNFLYFYIGLRNVPPQYLEAADIDGANEIQKFFRIKLPLITPTIFFVVVIACIDCFGIFTEPYLLTSGGPGTSTQTVALIIYKQSIQSQKFGYAAAIASVFFLIVLVMTIIQFVGQKRWVSYNME